MSRSQIASWRSATAGFAASAAAGLTAAVILRVAGGSAIGPGILWLTFLVGTAIALPHAAALGGVLYLMLIERWPVRWDNAALAGTAIGALPVTILQLSQMEGAPLSSFAIQPTLFCGACGLVGGIAFRAVRGVDRRGEGDRA